MIRKPEADDVPSSALCESLRRGGIRPGGGEAREWLRSPFVLSALILAAIVAGPVLFWTFVFPMLPAFA